jgi:ParB family chromosome partitioning protein
MALGRGLGELLGEIETAYENSDESLDHDIKELNIDVITPNPFQPRKVFNEEKLQELCDSIKTHGLLQPVVVTKNEDGYLLIAGERRLRASKMANCKSIKAIVVEVEENKLRELALIENIQRDDLNIIEVANSYAGLINDFDMTHDELAKIVSKSRSSITNTLRLLTLSKYAQDELSKNNISVGHAKVIIGLDNDEQKLVVDSVIGQKLSVRDTEALVKRLKSQEEEKNIKKCNNNDKLDFELLQDVTKNLKDKSLKVKLDKNYLKIKIESQNDIENILNYFQNK